MNAKGRPASDSSMRRPSSGDSDAVPFLNLLADDYRSPWGLTELTAL